LESKGLRRHRINGLTSNFLLECDQGVVGVCVFGGGGLVGAIWLALRDYHQVTWGEGRGGGVSRGGTRERSSVIKPINAGGLR